MAVENRQIHITHRDAHVGFNKRELAIKPSKEIEWIQQRYNPNLIDIRLSQICYTTTVNYIGCLLIERHKDEITKVFEQYGIKLPILLAKPLTVRSDEPIHALSLKDDASRPVMDETGKQMVAKRVLVKHAIGRSCGLVLDEPLAGLVLDDQLGFKTEYLADKVMEDYSLFRPDGSLLKYYKNVFEQHTGPQELTQNILTLLLNHYQHEASERNNAVELFAHLYSQVYGEEINLDTFHRTVAA